jgi:hypothetical protein
MKKKIFTLLALFACVLSASADNTITVSEALIPAGKSGSFNIELTNTDEFKGFTMFLTLPSGVTLESVTSSDRLGDLEDPTGSNPYGLGYIAMKPIAGNSGTLITVTVKADAGLAVGSKLDAKLDKITFGKSDGSGDVTIADVNFQIEITNKIILDETSTVPPTAQKGVDVFVKRTLKKGAWNTVCLPFAIKSKTSAEAIFGEGCEILTYSGYAATIDEETLIPSAIKLNFSTLTPTSLKPMKAGSPYLVKPTKEIETFEVSNVDIVSTVTAVEGKEVNYDLDGKFTGSLVKTTVPKNGLFISGDKFYYSTGATNIKGFRGWFELAAVLNVAVVVDAPIYMDIDGNTTKINVINEMSNDGEYYDLNGIKVINPTKKGVYIQNGKKVVIK